MAFILFEQVSTTAAIKDATHLSIPPTANGARIVADTVDCRYTMDGITNPSQTSGMIFTAVAIHDIPSEFDIDDVRRIKFTRGAGADGKLNIHYFSGRRDL